MASPITVIIPLHPWMKKYLQYESTGEQETPIQFPRRHRYNILLSRLVSNRSDIKSPRRELDKRVNVRIALPYNQRKDVYSYNKISGHNRRLFRRTIADDFHFDFLQFAKQMRLKNYTIKQAVEEFLLKYGITEEEMSSESLYRYYHRQKNFNKN